MGWKCPQIFPHAPKWILKSMLLVPVYAGWKRQSSCMTILTWNMAVSSHASARPVGNAGCTDRHMKHNTERYTSLGLPVTRKPVRLHYYADPRTYIISGVPTNIHSPTGAPCSTGSPHAAPELVREANTIWFIDNVAALVTLVSRSENSRPLGQMAKLVHPACFAIRSVPYFKCRICCKLG